MAELKLPHLCACHARPCLAHLCKVAANCTLSVQLHHCMKFFTLQAASSNTPSSSIPRRGGSITALARTHHSDSIKRDRSSPVPDARTASRASALIASSAFKPFAKSVTAAKRAKGRQAVAHCHSLRRASCLQS